MTDEFSYRAEAAAEYDRAFSHVSAHFLPSLLRSAQLVPGQRIGKGFISGRRQGGGRDCQRRGAYFEIPTAVRTPGRQPIIGADTNVVGTVRAGNAHAQA